MGFLAPLMLIGAATASIPILLHVFYRSRYRRVPWAAMKFLRLSIEQTSRRVKFQEILLLIARVTVLALLAFALARPSTRAGTGAAVIGDAVDTVFIMDTSYSMAARDGTATRFERAKAAALAVIDHLPSRSTLQIVACADRATLLGPRIPDDFGQARQLIQNLELSSLATNFLPGFDEAAAALKRGHASNKEVYLFSDMQTLGWDAQKEAIPVKCREMATTASVYLVRCGTRTPRNAAIVGIAPQLGIPHTGERAGFAVLVRNSGAEPVRNLTITLAVDDLEKPQDSEPIPEIGPGETRAVTLTAKLEKAGLRVVTARIQGDELDADNRFDQVLNVRDQVRVLVIDGSPNDREPDRAGSYYLTHSLRPVPETQWGKYHLQPRVVTPGQASPAQLADKDLCILVNAPIGTGTDSDAGILSAQFLDELTNFVREGHGLMIFAGPRVQADAYNRAFTETNRLLPLKLTRGAVADANKPFRLDPGSIDAASFLGRFREEPLDRIGQVEVLQTLDVEDEGKAEPATNQSESARVELRYSNGRPAVISKRFGEGEVILVTTSADARWTDWPLRQTYLPFLHVAVNHLLHEQTQLHNRRAGEPIVWRPPGIDAARSFQLTRPDGHKQSLGAPKNLDGKLLLTTADTLRAGVYRLALERQTTANEAEPAPEGLPFAVVPDPYESTNLESLTDTQIDERLGFQPIHLTAAEEGDVFSGSERFNREWTLWLLLIVFFVFLGEAFLAWLCGRAW